MMAIFDTRACHNHCIEKKCCFFTLNAGKSCKIYHIDPSAAYPAQNIHNLFTWCLYI